MKSRQHRLALATVAVAALVAGCASTSPNDGWVTLIDGNKGMENFTTQGSANWRAEADAIVADRREGTAGQHYLTTKTSYRNFDLRAEFWVSDDANSGIYMRCTADRPMTDRTCYEANIFDKRGDPTFATGAIVWMARTLTPVPLAGGKWNVMEVSARGNRMTVTLNGVKTAESNDLRDDGGVIGLQYAGGVVKFRKLQIKPL